MADVITVPQSECPLVETERRTATTATTQPYPRDGASVPPEGGIGFVIHSRVVSEFVAVVVAEFGAGDFFGFFELELGATAMASLIAAPSPMCCSASSFFTPTPVQSPKSSSASASVSLLPAIVCGRGDKRTAKGKRKIGSFGNCRPKDSSKGTGLAITPLPPRPKRDDSADNEYIHIDIDETLFN